MRVRWKNFLGAVLAAVMAFGLTAAPARADELAGALSVDSVSACPGQRFTVSVHAEGLDSISMLELYVNYDPDILSVMDSTENSVFTISSVNMDTEGVVRLDAASTEGLNGDYYSIMTLEFEVKESASVGVMSPVSLAVGEVYRFSEGRNIATSLGLKTGYVTVVEQPPASPEKVSFWSYPDKGQAAHGDEINITVYVNDPKGLAAGTVTLEYDRTLVKLLDTELLTALDGTISDVNSEPPGRVQVSFSQTGGKSIPAGELLRCKFSVTANIDCTAEFLVSSSDLYSDARIKLDGEDNQTWLSIQRYPVMAVSGPKNVKIGESLSARVTIEGVAGLAAGDFSIAYEKTAFRIDSVAKPAGLSSTVVVTPDWNDGFIRFSVLDGDGITADTVLLEISMTALSVCDTRFILKQTSQPRDADSSQLTLSYSDHAISITPPILSFAINGSTLTLTVFEPGQLEDGSQIVVASYDSAGRMIRVDLFGVSSLDKNGRVALRIRSGATYRAFLVNSEFVPCCKPAVWPMPG